MFCPMGALYFLHSAAGDLCFSEVVFFVAMLRRGPCFYIRLLHCGRRRGFFPFALQPEDVVEREVFVSFDFAVL